MGIALIKGIVGIISLVLVTTTYTRVQSTAYPYSLVQPSSYRYVVIPNAGEQNVDLYAPANGSAATAVTVYAAREAPSTPEPVESAIEYFLTRDGRHVHRSGKITILGKTLAVECADFKGYRVSYRQEQVTFQAAGYFWRLTVSYELKYGHFRHQMLNMLRSFKLR